MEGRLRRLAMSAAKKLKLSPEIQLLLRQANVAPEHAETQLRERVAFQMREYLRVLNYHLQRECQGPGSEPSEQLQIEHLLRAIHYSKLQSATPGCVGA